MVGLIMADIDTIYNSFEEACSEGNLSSVEELVQKLQEEGKKDKKANSKYIEAVAKTIETFQGNNEVHHRGTVG